MQAKRIPCSSHAWKGPRHYWNSFNQSKLPFGYPPRRYRRRGSLSRGTRRESFLLSGFIHSNPRPTTALHLSSELLLSSSASFLRLTLFFVFSFSLSLSLVQRNVSPWRVFLFREIQAFELLGLYSEFSFPKLFLALFERSKTSLKVEGFICAKLKKKKRNSKRFYKIYVCLVLIKKLF